MKKLGILLLIVIACMSVTVSCTPEPDDKKPLLMNLFGFLGGMTFSGDEIVHEVIFGPAAVTATGGDYTDRVGINWELKENALSYNVYRSENFEGPFDLIANVNAEDIDTTPGTVTNPTETPVPPPDFPDPPTTPPTYEAVFQSNVDLNKEWVINFFLWKEYHYGIKVDWGQVYNITITVNGITKTVSFIGSIIPLTTVYYNQTEVISRINQAFGSTVCYPVNVGDARYLRLVSNSGPIVLENAPFSIGLESPLRHFLSSSADSSTVITINPTPVNTDTTPPTVMTVYPADGATNIALDVQVWALFSEAILASSVTGTSFTLKKGTEPVAGAVTSTAIFTPSAELEPDTTYTATLTTAITDLSGNHLTAVKTWSFTTGGSTSTVPAYCYEDTSAVPGTHYYYHVTSIVDDLGTESVESPMAEGYAREISVDPGDPIPGKVTGCSATDGASGTVTVTWNALADADYYRVYRTSGSTTVQVGGSIAGTSYEDSSVEPGLYTYRVSPFNSSNQEGISSDPDTGFRSVTDEDFFLEVYKENYWALDQIQSLKGSTDDMLNTEIVPDADGDGTLIYEATANLSKATVTLTFINFCSYYLTQNTPEGEPITMTLNNPLGSCSGPMMGVLYITGIYNGYVRYDFQVVGGNIVSGNYWVSQNGGAETAIPYDSPLIPVP
ncbi:MAG: Ig-like domain-containing protein [Spirochaetes bacterium]|nr:Ig-like domain-containing protein [Spirochaetota bacterium]